MVQEYVRRVTSVVPDPHAVETTADLLAGATLIPLSDSGDFTEAGGSVRIDGEVYTFSAMDEGDVSGVPSITLDSGLLADAPAETVVEEWNAAKGEVVTDWVATVTDEVDGSVNTAYLTHALIPMVADGLPIVGEQVTVQVDDMGIWWVTEVHGSRPRIQPGYFVSGGIGTDTVIYAGTADGRRAQLDGIDGALEAFNDANEQTVNLDGETNYIEGTLATAADGSRVEIGPGAFALPTNEVRLYSGHADETEPGILRGNSIEIDPGFPRGVVTLTAQEMTGVPGTPPRLFLFTGDGDAELSRATLESAHIDLDGIVSVDGTLNATMGSGSVGTGTFRDSVDARVTALGGAAYQPLDADLTAIAALATTAYGRSLLEAADAAAARGLTGAAAAADLANYLTTAAAAAGYQPLDADLTAIAALTTTATGRSLLAAADASAIRTISGSEQGWTYERLTSDFTRNLNTFANVFTGFNAQANTNYEFEIVGAILSDAATTGFQSQMLGTTGENWVSYKIVSAASASTDLITNAGAWNTINLATAGLATPNIFTVRGMCSYGASPGATNIRLQARVETAVIGTITMKAGSYMRWRVLA